jgi:Holliday junction DNA helicase RuvA
MIGFIKGTIEDIEEDRAVVDCNGIGYNIFMPSSVLSNISIGATVKIYTYLAVREDAMNLFGFLGKQDLDIFKKLITVSGIGPKGGLSIMSVMTADEVRMAIITGDHKAISKAPGVGAKTAMKVIVELKDKVNLEDVSFVSGAAAPVESNLQKEAVMALVALGYSEHESALAVKKVDGALYEDVETLIKEALRKMI